MGRAAKPWARSDNGRWYVWHGNGQVPLRESGTGRHLQGEADREAAQRAFHLLKADADAHATQRAAPVTLAAISGRYLAYSEKNHEPETLYRYRRFVAGFMATLPEDMEAESVRPLHVTRWVDAKKWKNNSRSNAAGVIAAMFNWAANEGHIERNPIAKLARTAKSRREVVLSAAQGEAAVAACETPAFRSVLVALRETGCRPKEIYTLTIDRVDIEAGTWRVIDKIRGKTGENYRTVYLSPRAIELTGQLIGSREAGYVFLNTRGKRWHTTTAWHQFHKIKDALGYGAECILYSYRHLYITDALERGVPPATVAQLVGHRDLTMIMRIYSRLSDRTAHLREAAATARGNSEQSTRRQTEQSPHLIVSPAPSPAPVVKPTAPPARPLARRKARRPRPRKP